MSIKGKLARMKSHIIEDSKNITKQEVTTSMGSSFLHAEEWKSFQVTPFYFDNSFSLVREIEYPLDYQYGRYQFKELKQVIEKWNDFTNDHPIAVKDNSVEDLIFLDTETTGLSRGVGNTIFMIGYARIKKETVNVTQHFLPSPSSEVAMYQAFLTDIGNIDSLKLTSYNGKAFDWPQIKTRHTLIRDSVPKLPPFGHIDLLHASRRLWKEELESVKLSIVEKEMLHVFRKEDVPGYLAPMIYLDYIKDGNPEGIKGVFQHNEWDVLTLISLFIHLSNRILDHSFQYCSSREMFEVARWFHYLGHDELAMKYYHHLIKADNVFKDHSLYAIALCYKKRKEFEKAAQILEELQDNKELTFAATNELAKIYEHRLKDPVKAFYFTSKGLSLLKAKHTLIPIKEKKNMLELEKRLERLLQKMK